MILIVLWFILSLASAVGLALPAATAELSAGRNAFLAVKARRLADGELALVVDGPWPDSARANPGRRWTDLGESIAGVIRVARWMESVPGPDDVRVLGVEVDLLDRAGRNRATRSAGRIVQFSVSATDSSMTVRGVARGGLSGTQ